MMGVLSDKQIREQIEIEPFIDYNQSDQRTDNTKGNISYGLTSYGYDVRLSRQFKIFTNVYGAIVDPKNFDKKAFVDFEGDECVIPPNSFALGMSYETVSIPRNIHALCVGKSTYARCGIIVCCTPLESMWCGAITIEISNSTPLPCRVYAMEGIMQVIFLEGSEVCERSYADKNGRYQNQTEITLPFVK